MIVKNKESNSMILLAGMSNRNPKEFDAFFEKTAQTLRQVSGNSRA
jgi:hypothetical protein